MSIESGVGGEPARRSRRLPYEPTCLTEKPTQKNLMTLRATPPPSFSRS